MTETDRKIKTNICISQQIDETFVLNFGFEKIIIPTSTALLIANFILSRTQSETAKAAESTNRAYSKEKINEV